MRCAVRVCEAGLADVCRQRVKCEQTVEMSYSSGLGDASSIEDVVGASTITTTVVVVSFVGCAETTDCSTSRWIARAIFSLARVHAHSLSHVSSGARLERRYLAQNTRKCRLYQGKCCYHAIDALPTVHLPCISTQSQRLTACVRTMLLLSASVSGHLQPFTLRCGRENQIETL